MNDRMLLESQCNKSLKVGQQEYQLRRKDGAQHFPGGIFCEDGISTRMCDDLYLSFNLRYNDQAGIY